MQSNPFISYSQNGEDVILWRALKDVSRGRYIDVGAQDPVVDSVTKAFYERGWVGINIEPVRHWYERLVRDRPHDINLRVAVSNQPGFLKLFEVEESGLSTSDPEFARRHAAGGHALHECEVKCVTLDQICTDHDIDIVHFLKIDCEGSETASLQGFSLSDVRPWIILVEATEPNSTTPTWRQWEPLLTGRGYQFVFFDGLNRYYLADEQMHLAPAFGAPVNVFDHAKRFSEANAEAQIDRLRGEVESLKGAATNARLQAELSTITSERDVARAERDSVTIQLDTVKTERDIVGAERDAARSERDAMKAERDAIMRQRNEMADERDAAVAERDAAVGERGKMAVERDAARAERDWIAAERDNLRAIREALLASHSWRLTAPLRGCSVAIRSLVRRLRKSIYLLLRPCAHLARPFLRRTANWPLARKVVIHLFGSNSRTINLARLFLFGAPATLSASSVVAPNKADEPTDDASHRTLEPPDACLSARGREILHILDDMRVRVNGD